MTDIADAVEQPAATGLHTPPAITGQPTVTGKSTAVALAALLILYGAWALRFYFHTDDAYISYCYARNLANGHGLRFNVNEDPPVEGFSNFLWVITLAGGGKLNLAAPTIAPQLSLACGAVLVARLLVYLRRSLSLRPPVAVLTMLFFVALPPVAIWSTGGLATMPFALLVFLAFERLLGDPQRPRAVQAGLFGLAAALIRADGLGWVLLIGVIAACRFVVNHDRARWSALAVYGGIVLMGFGAFLAWRLSYFGYPLPNTAYVKGEITARTLERGLRYCVSFPLTLPAAGLVLLGSLSLLGRVRFGPALASTLMIAGTFGYATLVGGDFMAMGRFFVVSMPFLAVLFGLVLSQVWGASGVRKGATVMITAVFVALSILPAASEACSESMFPAGLRQAVRFRWKYFRRQHDPPRTEYQIWQASAANAKKWAILGRELKSGCKPGESLVRGGIGAIGYYSDLILYDTAGLTDPQVARRPMATDLRSAGHDKVVGIAYFEKYKPTYGFVRIARSRDTRDVHRAAVRIFNLYMSQPEERDSQGVYEPEVLPLPKRCEWQGYDYLILARRRTLHQ